jgi:hypothetical protein
MPPGARRPGTRPDGPLWRSWSRCDRQRKLGRASGGVARNCRQREHGPERRVEQRQCLRRQRRQCVQARPGGGWEQHTSNGWQPATPSANTTSQLNSVRQGQNLGNARASGQVQRQKRFWRRWKIPAMKGRVNVSVRRLAACLCPSALGSKTGFRCD